MLGMLLIRCLVLQFTNRFAVRNVMRRTNSYKARHERSADRGVGRYQGRTGRKTTRSVRQRLAVALARGDKIEDARLALLYLLVGHP
jgi:hypothetical protein